MKIELTNVAKRFNYDWIFRRVNYRFEAGNQYAITGANGSGKSTLLKIISGQLTPSEGKISYQTDAKDISIDEIYRSVSYAAPYIDLIDDLTFDEAIRFHSQFKPFQTGLTLKEIKSAAGLTAHSSKFLKEFSSGMRQRVKLILSILSDSKILLLDEPTTNLDDAGVNWYLDLIRSYSRDRIIIVGSNQQREYSFCPHIIQMQQYKGLEAN